jgi:anti-sigma B factor antagonist
MEYTIGGDAHVAIVAPAGEIDVAVAPRLQAVLKGLLDEGRTRVVVDMSGITFIDSAGLGILVNAYKVARAQGGGIKFAAAVPEVRRLFQITRTDKYLEFYDGLDAARQSFDGA